MPAQHRQNYEDDAEDPFLADRPDPRIREWGRPTDSLPGAQGLCWYNARTLAGSAPKEYLYAEGLAFNHGEWSGHGWVVRKSDGEVVECTAGYQTSTKYRGICFEVADVEEFIDSRPPVNGQTCRERWRKIGRDGSVESEAPGIMWILAEEGVVQRRDPIDWWREMESWLNSGKCPPVVPTRP